MGKYVIIHDRDPPLNQPKLSRIEENSVLYAVFPLLLTFWCSLSSLTVATWAFWTYWKVMN